MSTATIEQAKHILNLIGQKEVSKEQLVVFVNRDLSLAEMISAGKYDCVNDGITTERFPIKGRGVADTSFKLVPLDRNIESDEAVEELAKHGLRPADLAELLAFGAAFPEEQRKYPVAGLGSVAKVDGRRYVADLNGSGSKRVLGLYRWDGGWGDVFRFLAARI